MVFIFIFNDSLLKYGNLIILGNCLYINKIKYFNLYCIKYGEIMKMICVEEYYRFYFLCKIIFLYYNYIRYLIFFSEL